MFKIEKHIVPSVISEIFVKNSLPYFTRQSDYLHVPIIKTTTSQKTLLHTGVTIWNYLLNKININCTITTFKHRLKKYLLNNDISLTETL